MTARQREDLERALRRAVAALREIDFQDEDRVLRQRLPHQVGTAIGTLNFALDLLDAPVTATATVDPEETS